jgi:hypothetical protein
VIGFLTVCFIPAMPAPCALALVPLGLAAHAIGLVLPPRILGAMAVSATLSLALIFPAEAQTDQQISRCNGQDNATPELAISSCTAMIQSGEYAGNELAIVFNNRGVAYFKNGQFETAIQDLDQAIRLRPNFFNVLTSRGFAYLKMKNYGAAITDFDAALEAHPESALALYGRGLAKRGKGDAAASAADIAAAQRLDATIVQGFAGWDINLDPPAETKTQQGPPAADPVATSPAVLPEVQSQAGPEAPSQSEGAISEVPALPPATATIESSATPEEPSQTAAVRAAEEIVSLPLPAEVTEALIKRGDQLMSTGDIVGARFAYERAAGGSRDAAKGVAKTYDPIFLAQRGARGLRGDAARAALWYGKAAAAGDREAEQRLRQLRAQFPE